MQDHGHLRHEALESFLQQIKELADPKLRYFGYQFVDSSLSVQSFFDWIGKGMNDYEGAIVYRKAASLGGELQISISGTASD